MPPILAPAPVRAIWSQYATNGWSRSLWLERLADPRKKDSAAGTPRKDFLDHGCRLRPLHHKPRQWLAFLRQELRVPWERLRFGQVQSRLLLNAAGGVIENAGLCLDRFSGQPFVPGSANKGCARRFAIQDLVALRDRLFSNEPLPPGATPHVRPADDRLTEMAESVVRFLKVFGWADVDWRGRREFRAPRRKPDEDNLQFRMRRRKAWCERRPDLAWACGDCRWLQVRALAASSLAAWLGVTTKSRRPLWKVVANFCGTARFLPAFPVQVEIPDAPLTKPEYVGALELDVLACHHQAYYADAARASAPDTEDPNLVFFPTVAAGHVFVFAVLGSSESETSQAREWLTKGLETFGLGAKTAAGYGWFRDVSDLATGQLMVEERLQPWLETATTFNDLAPRAREETCLRLASEPDLLGHLAKSAPRKAKHLIDFCTARAPLLTPTIRSLLERARQFDGFASEEKETLALELSALDERQQVSELFPLILASALAFMAENGL